MNGLNWVLQVCEEIRNSDRAREEEELDRQNRRDILKDEVTDIEYEAMTREQLIRGLKDARAISKTIALENADLRTKVEELTHKGRELEKEIRELDPNREEY